jgi:NAD(P)H-hydrate epimerase
VADRQDEGLEHGWELPRMDDAGLDTDEAFDAALAGADIIVDGILGTGIRGAPRERQARAIRAVNRVAERSEVRVLALDVPSGANADTGAVEGDVIQADVTVGFGWPKLGSLVQPGRVHGGRLVTVEIGFPPAVVASFGQSVITPGWAHASLPERKAETHKYAAGTLLLVAGRAGMGGAAVMAARAAQRAGLGLLRVASAPENREILQTTAPEAIFVDVTDADAVAAAQERSAALAVGPGLGTDAEAAAILESVLEAGPNLPTVLDADALTLCGSGAAPALADVAASRPLILTPHTGELERITSYTRGDVARDRVGVARSAAGELGATVLLKGIPSVVAAPDGHVRIDVVGTSDLATGGIGDVLTGVVGSFLGQGLEPADAGALGLFMSGRAAVLADRGAGLIPDDVIARLPDALRETGPGHTELDMGFVVFDRDLPG